MSEELTATSHVLLFFLYHCHFYNNTVSEKNKCLSKRLDSRCVHLFLFFIPISLLLTVDVLVQFFIWLICAEHSFIIV